MKRYSPKHKSTYANRGAVNSQVFFAFACLIILSVVFFSIIYRAVEIQNNQQPVYVTTTKPNDWKVIYTSTTLYTNVRAGPDNIYPNRQLTPGSIMTMSTGTICVTGYTSTVRDVSKSTKDKVFLMYNITSHAPYSYEVDHMIPLCLGGSNEINNLWPEPYEPKPGAREKDVVENWFCHKVCNGNISLQEAQRAITEDWYAVYLKIKET